MATVRLARARTGRRRVLMVAGAWHGMYDVTLVGSGQDLRAGIPSGVSQDTLVVEQNNLESLRSTLDAHGDSIAAIIVDLLPNHAGLIAATKEFVDALKDGATACGALLVVDEVISFRLGWGGLQGDYDLQPDITVLGKLIGGGLPIGAIVGTAEAMAGFSPFTEGGIVHGGTFAGNPVTLRAGRVALEMLTRGAIDHINELGELLRGQLSDVIDEHGLPWDIRGTGSLVRLIPLSDGSDAAAQLRSLWWEAYRRGVLLTPAGLMAVSTPFTPETISRAAGNLSAALVAAATSRMPVA
jgi:glutamate-1-semialdehyde 2,1-aminomutase